MNISPETARLSTIVGPIVRTGIQSRGGQCAPDKILAGDSTAVRPKESLREVKHSLENYAKFQRVRRFVQHRATYQETCVADMDAWNDHDVRAHLHKIECPIFLFNEELTPIRGDALTSRLLTPCCWCESESGFKMEIPVESYEGGSSTDCRAHSCVCLRLRVRRAWRAWRAHS
jgi:hypothetical protein